MFWRFGGYASISTIDSLLEKPDVTVDELLDESDLIQELKSQNSKLIEFLRDENVLDRLLQYTILPKAPEDEATLDLDAEDDKETPSGNPLNFFGKGKRRSRSKSIKDVDEESKEEKQRTKYAYVACEVLSSDVWSIAEALLENRECMRRFWRYLKRESPLDPVQANYFTRVNESLLDKKADEMMEFFKSVEDVVPDMLRHVDCPTIMDLLLKIISLERTEAAHGIIDWLQSQNLIPLLLSNLSPDREASTQTSAGDFLKAIIAMSANATAQDSNVIGPNELTRQLVSEECVSMLLKDMLRGGNPLTVGVGIVIEVIRKNNSDYDLPENQSGPVPRSSDPIYLGTLLRQFAENIPSFMNLIQNADAQKKELKVAFGSKIEPLGFDRFKTCEIMAELLHCSNMQLLNQPGSDRDVKARDAERGRLKVEGKLLGYNDASSALEFGTSVDSSGFHHARAPSFGDVTLESKRLEVSNSTEEDFENVMASDALGEDDKIDFDEKDGEAEKPALNSTDIDKSIKEIDAIAAGTAQHSVPQEENKTSCDEHSNSVDSPTRSELAEKLRQVGVDEMPPAPEPPEASDQPQAPKPQLDALRPEDTPAPLFANKPRQKEHVAASDTTMTDLHSVMDEGVVLDEPTHSLPYEPDIDGTPVIGDLLKMKFVEHRVVPTILDFFFRFPWNNFLHNVVYDVVQQVFNGQMERGFNRSLAIDMFDTARITERIIEGQAASDKSQEASTMRLGYMGHLTLIAEEVVKFTERIPPETFSPLVMEKVTSQGWIHYVDHTLAETRERDNAILGGVRPDASLGPRQAVMNAVTAAQGFGSLNSLGGLGGGLSHMTGNTSLGLDSLELPANSNSAAPGASSYLFSGSALMSGFSHGSSDEEDEDMDEADDRLHHIIDESDQARSSFHADRVEAYYDDTDAVDALAAVDVINAMDAAAAAAVVADHGGNGHDPADAGDVDAADDEVLPAAPAPPTASSSSPADAAAAADPAAAKAGMPAPLNFHPTRARRQFAARLAQRRREQKAAQQQQQQQEQQARRAEEARLLGGVGEGVKEARRRRYGEHGALAGLDDDDDDDEDDDVDGDVVRGLEVDFFGSDDSVEGEDVGIVMRKSWRRPQVTEGREREILD